MKKTFLALALTASTFAINSAVRSQGLESVSIKGVTSAAIADNFESTVSELQQIKSDALSRSEEFTLDEALKYALANNPTINAAYKSVQSKQWTAISDKRLWWPTIMGAGPYGDLTTIPTYPSLGQRFTSKTGKTRGSGMNMLASTPQLGPYGTVNNPIDSNSFAVVDSFNPALIARWTFFDLARGETINASTEAAKAEELLFNMTVRNTVLDLNMKYYQLFAKQNLLQSLEKEYKANLQQLNDLIATQNNNSLEASSAITRTKTTLYLQLDELITAYVDYIKASAAAAKAMGLPIGKLMKPSDSFSMQPMNAWSMTLQETLEHALGHREEIKLAKTIAKSQNHLATSLLYSYLPKISIFGYGSYSNETGILDFSMATEKDFGAYREGWEGNIGLMFSWMFDGSLAAKSTSLKYAAKQQMQKAKETENLVAEQVSTTYAEYIAAKLSLANAKMAYESALQTRESTQQLRSANSTDYSNAAQSVGNAAKNYAGAIFKYNASLSMLYRFSSIWPSSISEELNNAVKILKEE
ncbi:MAG: TolC family protein [Synechococcus sp. BS307-5m-G38]|nr:TolC family protein [Synechococcus sp. BS307-5m-G38]